MEGASGRSTKDTEMSKQTRTAQAVTENVELEFVDQQGEATALEADLVFDPADPFAVTMVFRNSTQEVRWTFGRELLVEGLYEPTGDGDVHVWPCLSSNGTAVVIIELCSPDGELLVQAHSRVVNQFVTRMLAAVPDGQESAFVDFDGELARILSV
ncbi:SsgA family sporulation/cell division regulator [Nocardioides marmoraquaticus]